MIIDLNNIIVFLYAIIGATMGAVATYFGTIKLQKRAWKREDIKDIYAPLRTEFELNKKNCKILDKLLSKIWDEINQRHLVWLITEELRTEMAKFYKEDLKKFNSDREKACRKIANLTEEFLETELKKQKRKKNKEDIYELEKTFNLNKSSFLDENWRTYVLREKLENKRYLDGRFKNIKVALKLDFISFEEFFNYFSNEFKKSQEYETLLENKNYILKEINNLLKQINQKIGVE